MNKIKLKLTGDQCGIFTTMIQECPATGKDPFSLLIMDLMMQVLEKMHGRSLWMNKKCAITLTSAEARAFQYHFIQFEFSGYELNLVTKTIGTIDQQLNNGIITRKTQNQTKRIN